MIVPEQASVRPRVLSPATGEALLLEEEVRRLVEARATGVIALLGGAGSGKTTALRHLAAVLTAEAPVDFLDEGDSPSLGKASGDRLVIYASAAAKGKIDHLECYRLAPWNDDDLIEYLLARHHDRCASVLARLGPGDRLLLDGLPDLWQIVLEQLAGDESVPDVRTALYRYLESHLRDSKALEQARRKCLNCLATPGTSVGGIVLETLSEPGFAHDLLRVLGRRSVQVLLASDRIAVDLGGTESCDYLGLRLPRDLVHSAAAAVANVPSALDRLRRLLAGPSWSHAMAASLLHIADRTWIPEPGSVPVLAGAYLHEAQWQGVHLPGAKLAEADLRGADLRGAVLTGANLDRASLGRARLSGATLEKLEASAACLEEADLAAVRAESARFDGGNLERSKWDDAVLPCASFVGASLNQARFCRANLLNANLLNAKIDGADFSGANLTGARLAGLPLREANFAGACFARAWMKKCNLEYMDLPAGDFESADLEGALLTGSSMPDARFDKARLCETGLADINWEGASLRGADLRGASFHMGSTRSGLVLSPIACEGSRTGFYTDDYDDQSFKAPEEIRKANLCRADLRDARLDDVDFYLVDLRGALFDPEHETHFRRCGAIMGARV